MKRRSIVNTRPLLWMACCSACSWRLLSTSRPPSSRAPLRAPRYACAADVPVADTRSRSAAWASVLTSLLEQHGVGTPRRLMLPALFELIRVAALERGWEQPPHSASWFAMSPDPAFARFRVVWLEQVAPEQQRRVVKRPASRSVVSAMVAVELIGDGDGARGGGGSGSGDDGGGGGGGAGRSLRARETATAQTAIELDIQQLAAMAAELRRGTRVRDAAPLA